MASCRRLEPHTDLMDITPALVAEHIRRLTHGHYAFWSPQIRHTLCSFERRLIYPSNGMRSIWRSADTRDSDHLIAHYNDNNNIILPLLTVLYQSSQSPFLQSTRCRMQVPHRLGDFTYPLLDLPMATPHRDQTFAKDYV
eukprot:2548739-Pleurochrysis_carterae.AAC.1